jgi:hypothetical protein
MTFLLQFCGFSDPLHLFYLEQQRSADPTRQLPVSGPVFGGFRPFRLDDLLGWAQGMAQGRGWDLESIQRTVVDEWMVRADVIRQWQLRLREEPQERLLVAGLGTERDWRQHCEQLLRV